MSDERGRELWYQYVQGKIKFDDLSHKGKKIFLQYGIENNHIAKEELKDNVIRQYGLEGIGLPEKVEDDPSLLQTIGQTIGDFGESVGDLFTSNKTQTVAQDQNKIPTLSDALNYYNDQFLGNRTAEYAGAWDYAQDVADQYKEPKNYGENKIVVSEPIKQEPAKTTNPAPVNTGIPIPETNKDKTTENTIASFNANYMTYGAWDGTNKPEDIEEDTIMSNISMDGSTGMVYYEPPKGDTLLESISEGWKTGRNQTKLALERYKEMTGEENEAKKYDLILQSHPEWQKKEDTSLFKQAVRGVFEQLPMWIESAKEGVQMALPGAAGGAATAAIIGQLGPQVATPEELITVPAAAIIGGKTGFAVGNTYAMYKIEAGYAFDEFIKEGIDPKIAKSMAHGVGLVNAGIEATQLSTVLKTFGIGAQAVRDIRSNVINKTAKKLAKQYAKGLTKETLQEVAQEAVTVSGGELAKEIDNVYNDKNLEHASMSTIGKRLLDTGVQSALTFSLMLAPGHISQVAASVNQGRSINRILDITEREINFAVESPEIFFNHEENMAELSMQEELIRNALDDEVITNPETRQTAEKIIENIAKIKVIRNDFLQTLEPERRNELERISDEAAKTVQDKMREGQNVDAEQEILNESNLSDVITPTTEEIAEIPNADRENIPQQEAQNIEIETSNQRLQPHGLTINRNTTNNQNPVWEIRGENLETLKDKLLPLGIKWFAPNKDSDGHFSFYSDQNPTDMIVGALEAKEQPKYSAEEQKIVDAINNRDFSVLTDNKGNPAFLKLFNEITGLSIKNEKKLEQSIRSLNPTAYDMWKEAKEKVEKTKTETPKPKEVEKETPKEESKTEQQENELTSRYIPNIVNAYEGSLFDDGGDFADTESALDLAIDEFSIVKNKYSESEINEAIKFLANKIGKEETAELLRDYGLQDYWNPKQEAEETQKPKETKDTYRYDLTQRPPSPGTIPKGATNVVDYGDKIDGSWGYVEYDTPLTEQQIEDYELKPTEQTKEIKPQEQEKISQLENEIELINEVIKYTNNKEKKETLTNIVTRKKDYIELIKEHGNISTYEELIAEFGKDNKEIAKIKPRHFELTTRTMKKQLGNNQSPSKIVNDESGSGFSLKFPNNPSNLIKLILRQNGFMEYYKGKARVSEDYAKWYEFRYDRINDPENIEWRAGDKGFHRFVAITCRDLYNKTLDETITIGSDKNFEKMNVEELIIQKAIIAYRYREIASNMDNVHDARKFVHYQAQEALEEINARINESLDEEDTSYEHDLSHYESDEEYEKWMGIEEKPKFKASATHTSNKTYKQQATFDGNTITVISKIGRKKVGEYSFTLEEWEKAKNYNANPHYGIHRFIKQKFEEVFPNGYPDDPNNELSPQDHLIQDSQRYAIQDAFKKYEEKVKAEETKQEETKGPAKEEPTIQNPYNIVIYRHSTDETITDREGIKKAFDDILNNNSDDYSFTPKMVKLTIERFPELEVRRKETNETNETEGYTPTSLIEYGMSIEETETQKFTVLGDTKPYKHTFESMKALRFGKDQTLRWVFKQGRFESKEALEKEILSKLPKLDFEEGVYEKGHLINDGQHNYLVQSQEGDTVTAVGVDPNFMESRTLNVADIKRGKIKVSQKPKTEKTFQNIGETGTAKTNDGKEIEFDYALVDADDLIASHDTALNRNPNYPEELQPRQRDRAVSKMQIDNIMSNLQPEFLGENPKVSDGAPIVGQDAVVESGNGRVIALTKMYHTNHESREKYIEWLQNNKEKFGIKGELPNNPVLVRIRKTDVDRVAFTKEANESSVAAMSATEIAKSDAEKLGSETLSLFAANDEGKINTAENRDFITSFVREVIPKSEHGKVLSDKGKLSQEGLTRVRNAIFFKAYNNLQIMQEVAESLDNNIKTITNTLINIAPHVVKIKEGIKNEAYYDLDFSNSIAKAAQQYNTLKENDTKIEEYLSQIGFIDDGVTAEAKEILNILDKNNRSAKKLTAFFNLLLDSVEKLGSPAQVNMFGHTDYTKADILQAAIRRFNNEQEGNIEGQITLLETEQQESESDTQNNRDERENQPEEIEENISLAEYGMRIEEGQTKKGMPLYSVFGNTYPYKDVFRSMKAMGYGKGKNFRWSFKQEDFESKEALEQEIISKLPKLESEESLENKEKVNTKEEISEQSENNNKEENLSLQQQAAKEIISYIEEGTKLTPDNLYAICDKVFGGSMADGKYDRKDAYDILELAVNQYILNEIEDVNSTPKENLNKLSEIIKLLPTQTVRTEDQVKYQQFSTPPHLAYVVGWVANINKNDTVLEPSAGIGGLAVFGKIQGAKVVVNELDKRRLEVIKNLPFDRFFNENAEQIDNIMPDNVKPTVVTMNPPFSATAGRMKNNNTKYAKAHIEQALSRLENDGRLVAIVGKGMAIDAPAFREWWNDLKKEYNVRANIGISGTNYKKYGTTFDNRIFIIDKTGPTTNEVVTGKVETLEELIDKLGGIHDDRISRNRQTESISNKSDSEKSTSKSGSENQSGHSTPIPTNGVDDGSSTVRNSGGLSEQGPTRTNDVFGESESTDQASNESDKQRDNTSGTELDQETSETSDNSMGDNIDSTRRDGINYKIGDRITINDGELNNIEKGNYKIVRFEANETLKGNYVMLQNEQNQNGDYGVLYEEFAKAFGKLEGAKPIDFSNKTKENKQETKVKTKNTNTNRKVEKELSDSIYSDYEPQKVKIKGAKKHPGELVESAAMSAVESPDVDYGLHLPRDIITEGKLSLPQLEAIVYAGQSHEKLLPNGQRRGFFIGDGTGVGKGREIAGIIMDNFEQGRGKAVWISKNDSLYKDAVRDWKSIGGEANKISPMKKFGLKKSIDKEKGIVFMTYGQVASGNTVTGGRLTRKTNDYSKKTRIEQLVEWLGEDFDGVIAFDESHLMKNSIKINRGGRQASEPSARGIAGVELQQVFPNARIVYVSATGATEVDNLAYGERLGLWGEGTAFPNKESFIHGVKAGGIAAMELIAQDLKAAGVYLARSLSYDGVGYERLSHKLTKNQKQIYNELAGAWQIVMQNVERALEQTGQQSNGKQKGNVWGQFWSNEQRFFNQILTSMQMPSVLEDMKNQIEEGNACVLQLVNTNEASQNRQAAKAQEEGDSYDDLDLTPRDILLEYLEKSFPIDEYEVYTDENGNERSRPVLDSEGNPVINRVALRMKNELMERVGSIRVPEGPLEIILNEFGTKNVAEVTGRKRRFVKVKDEKTGRIVTKQEKRSDSKVENDVKLFMDDKKQILIFSEAGGTGKSYHADLTEKNQRQRIHYLIQAGFKAESAVQGFGRTHRSNEANKPIYKLVTTDLKGHMRFISTIARRLDQLGALTRGQRQTGSQGLFSEKDNLENTYAKDALARFYRELSQSQTGREIIEKLGLKAKLLGEDGRSYSPDQETERNVTKFLNRILVLEYDMQNSVFDAFSERMESLIETAIANGTLETGLENFKAESIAVEDEVIVRTDDNTGVQTKYLQVKASNTVGKLTYQDMAEKFGNKLMGVYRNEKSGNVKAIVQYGDRTMSNGDIQKVYRLYSPKENDYNILYENEFIKSTWEKLSESQSIDAWEREYKNTSNVESQNLHLISGTLLPVWDRLPETKVRVMRLLTDEGRMLLGRLIPESEIDFTLQKLGAERKKGSYSLDEVITKVVEQNYQVELANGWRISRKRIAGANRIEITGSEMYNSIDILKKQGVFTEIINYKTRFFVPIGNAKQVLKLVTKYNPIVDVIAPDTTNNSANATNSVRGYRGNEAAVIEDEETNVTKPPNKKKEKIKPVSKIVAEMSKYFKIPVSSARYRSRKNLAQYRVFSEAIETKVDNNLGPIMHELGHHLDKKYKFSEVYEEDVSEMIENLDPSFSRYSEKELPGEAIAEFVRMYLIAPTRAQEFGGNFYEKFENTLSKRDFEQLQKQREDILNWIRSSLAEKIDSTIHSYTEKEKGEWSAAKLNAYMNFVDVLKPLDLFDKTVEKLSGKKLAAKDSAYLKAILSLNSNMISRTQITGALTNIEGEIIDKPLKAIYQKIKDEEFSMFDAYLKAKHSLSWYKQGKRVFSDDFKIDEIEQQVEDFENLYPHFKDTSEELYEWWQTFIQMWVVDTGLMKQDIWDKMKDMYPHYIPLFRVESSFVNTGKGKSRAKRGFANQNTPLKRASMRGSAKDTYSALESFILETDRIVKIAKRNDVMQTIHENASMVEGLAFILKKVPPKMLPNKFNTEKLKMDLNQEFLDNYIENEVDEKTKVKLKNMKWYEKLEYLMEQGYDVPNIIDNAIDDVITFFTPETFSKDANVVTVIDKNNKKHFYEVSDRYFLEAILNLEKKDLDKFTRLLAAIKRHFTVLTTGGNPVFGVTSNVWRDVPTAYIYGSIKNPAKFAKELGKSVHDVIKNDETMIQYHALGGGLSASPVSASRKVLEETLNELVPGRKKTVKHLSDFLISQIEKFNDALESMPRLTEYNNIIENEGDTYSSRLKAVYSANDVTLNFMRHGRIMNTPLGQMIPFLNAGIQGLDKLARATKDKEVIKSRLIKALTAITIFAIAQELILGDDDEYKALSSYLKDNYWLIKRDDGKFIRIPKPRDLGFLFGTLFQRGIRKASGDEQAFEDLGKTFFQTFMPPTRTIVAPITDVKSNESWMDTPIVSPRFPDEPSLQYDDSTSRLAVAISKVLPDSAGPFKSPINIDYLIKQYTGLFGQIILPATTKNKGVFEGITRKVTADVAFSNKWVDKFYDYKQELQNMYDEEKVKGKTDKKYKNSYRIQFNKQSEFLSKKWARIRKIQDDDDKSKKEKEEEIRKIRQEIMNKTKHQVLKYEAYLKDKGF